MLDNIDLTNVLVLDIETVSGYKSFDNLSEPMQKLWKIKAEQIQRRLPEEDHLEVAEAFEEKAGIYAEFGKIVCISVGVFKKVEGKFQFYLKSFYGDDEKKLLGEFSAMLAKFIPDTRTKYLCGHNIKEFDIPYTCRRMLIQGMQLPKALQINGKKPWELGHLLDTMEQWKFGDYKNYTALKLLCGVFGIPTPKDDIDGSEVGRTYWQENDVKRIEVYCKKDVLATARLLMAFKLLPFIEDSQVIDADLAKK